MKSILCIVLVLVGIPSAVAAEWCNLKGKIVIRLQQPVVTTPINLANGQQIPNEELIVDKDGGLANAIVYLRTPDVPIHPELAAMASPKVTIELINSLVRPHVTTMWIGKQSVEFVNRDPFGYNINVAPIGDTPINALLRPGDAVFYDPRRRQTVPVAITCNIHPWIKAYLLPRDNPYAAVTNAKGEFKLDKLPTGQLEFQLWHERYGYLETAKHPRGRVTLDLAPGERDMGTILLER